MWKELIIIRDEPEQLIDFVKNHYTLKKYTKNDSYYFEDAIVNFENLLRSSGRGIFTPYYIFKDKWYYCSPITDYILNILE